MQSYCWLNYNVAKNAKLACVKFVMCTNASIRASACTAYKLVCFPSIYTNFPKVWGKGGGGGSSPLFLKCSPKDNQMEIFKFGFLNLEKG